MYRVSSSPRRRADALMLGILTLLVSLAGLAACGTGTTSSASATATIDPQLRNYFDLLTTYYKPLGADMTKDAQWEFQTFRGYGNPGAPYPAADLQAMLQERPLEAQIASEAQALHDHMTVTPPTALRMDDTYLKQAAKATTVIYTKLLAAIDAHDVTGFVTTYSSDGFGNEGQYCPPVDDINAQMGRAHYSLDALLPVNANGCEWGNPTPSP